jgi:hypothetical protein
MHVDACGVGDGECKQEGGGGEKDKEQGVEGKEGGEKAKEKGKEGDSDEVSNCV